MAVRKKYEDVIIGVFIIAFLLYPFFVSFLIWSQEKERFFEEIEQLKRVGYFLLGQKACSHFNAMEVRTFLSLFLKEEYREKELLKLCLQSKVRFSRADNIDFYVKEDKGILKAKFLIKGKEVLSIKAKRYDNRIEVMEIKYD